MCKWAGLCLYSDVCGPWCVMFMEGCVSGSVYKWTRVCLDSSELAVCSSAWTEMVVLVAFREPKPSWSSRCLPPFTEPWTSSQALCSPLTPCCQNSRSYAPRTGHLLLDCPCAWSSRLWARRAGLQNEAPPGDYVATLEMAIPSKISVGSLRG